MAANANLQQPNANVINDQELIGSLIAPIIQMGKDRGYEVIENHDLGAGPVHAVWNFKHGSESIPDVRLGFICLSPCRRNPNGQDTCHNTFARVHSLSYQSGLLGWPYRRIRDKMAWNSF